TPSPRCDGVTDCRSGRAPIDHSDWDAVEHHRAKERQAESARCIPGRSPSSRNCSTGPSVTLRSIDEQRYRVAKVAPYYTITPESGEPRHRDVYHDHDNCSEGQRILPKHTVRGMGGHPK